MKKVLLVEGNDDRDFFQAYCALLNLSSVNVFPPRSLDANSGDGWSNLIKNLPILLNELKAGSLDRLGILLDADHPPNNSGGFYARYQLIDSQLQAFGYAQASTANFNQGEIFKHTDGLPDVGLWIMPNHQHDGMLEDFIEQLISDKDQLSLLGHAKKSIDSLPLVFFDKKLKSSKAKVFTWRAWQSRPGLPLNAALNQKILDRSKAANFEAWLKKVFA